MQGAGKGRAFGPGSVAALTALLGLLVPRWLTRPLVWALIALLPTPSPDTLDRWWRRRLRSRSGGRDPQASFLTRFQEQLLASGSLATLARRLAQSDRRQVAARIEAFVRVALLARLRHALLSGWDRPPPLAEVQLACCVECDQGCAGCYAAGDRAGTTPDRARLAELVDEAARAGAAAVHLIGKGEPFLSEPRALDLVAMAGSRPHMAFTVVTSGTRLTGAIAAALARTPNMLCFVSVDGFERLNDARRGAGSFRRTADGMRRLRERGAAFGFACTVTIENHAEVASGAFVQAMRDAGCCLGVYSRFFSLPPTTDTRPRLRLDPAAIVAFRASLAEARRGAGIPLFDIDDIEQASGCRARAGLAVYVDGTTGQVSPCIRVPYAPTSCRLSGAAAGELERVLRHPFFGQYRRGTCAAGSWCGADLEAEQAAVEATRAPWPDPGTDRLLPGAQAPRSAAGHAPHGGNP